MSELVVKKLRERFGDRVLHTHAQHGDETVVLDRSALHDACVLLKTDPELRFDLPIDVTAVDFLGYPGTRAVPYTGRFEVIYHLYSTGTKQRIRLKVPLQADDAVVPTVTDVWRGVDWFERETWDMFGIRFDGRPSMERILLYEEFVGHPLRKDYPRRGYQPRLPMPRLRGDRVPGLGAPEEDL